MRFEEKLTTLRKKNGMSQEDLAERLGVTRQAVSRWELGTTQPDAPNFLKLSDLFGVSIDWLLREGNPEQVEAPQTNSAVQTQTETKQPRHRGLLIDSIAFVIAAFAFLIAAIDRMSTQMVLLVLADAALAGVFLRKYLKSQPKE